MRFVVVLALLAGMGCGRSPAPEPSARVEAARKVARRHSGEAHRVLELVARRIDAFFSDREGGIDRFLDELFGFRGKWRACFWSREDFERHVRRRFASCLFRPEEFERDVVEPVRADLAFAMAACAGRVASDLDVELKGIAIGVPGAGGGAGEQGTLGSLVRRDLGADAVSIAGSEAAALLAAAGTQGAFAVAGAGAANSWWTFGISLAVGVVAAIAIDACAGEISEEAARMTIRAELARIRLEALDGPPGLWHAARRALEAHGRAMEEVAVAAAGRGGGMP